MLNENFVYLGVALSFLGALSYLIDTLKGRVQPNKVIWFVWSLAPWLHFGQQFNKASVSNPCLLSW
jgi:hypothetical protein